MRRFVAECLVFVLPLAVLLFGVEINLDSFPSSYAIKKAHFEQRLSLLQVLVLGDSHTFFGLAPAAWPWPGYNMANVSQTLFYDRCILARYIDRMPNLRLVVATLSYHSLWSEQLCDTEEHWRDFLYSRIYGFSAFAPWYDGRSYSLLASYGPDVTSRFMLGWPVPGVPTIADDGHQDLNGVMSESDAEGGAPIVIQRHHDMMDASHAAVNTGYLESMARTCHDRGIGMLVVTMPVSSQYYHLCHAEMFTEMHDLMARLHDQYGTIYRDDAQDPAFTTQDFYDVDHLNSDGALRYSKLLTETAHQAGRF